MAACILYGYGPPNVMLCCLCVSPPAPSPLTRAWTWWSDWRRGWISTPQISLSSRTYRHTYPAHTLIVTNNDLPCSLQAIHNTQDNWPHLKHLKRFCFVPLSPRKESEDCPDAAKTVCVKILCHTASNCRCLLFFWPFGVFDFSQEEKSGLITSRHILMSPLYSKQCLATIVTVHSVRKRAVKISNGKRRSKRKGSSGGCTVDSELAREKVVLQEAVNILMSGRTVLEPGLFCACTVVLLYIWCQTM